MKVSIHSEAWPFHKPFSIAKKTFNCSEVVVVELTEDEVTGRGEAAGVFFKEESPETMMQQIESIGSDIEKGLTREALLDILPPGGARCALDSALWDLEVKKRKTTIWKLVDIDPKPLKTVITLGLDDLDRIYEEAKGAQDFSTLKIKLDNKDPIERVKAVRKARPDATIVVDVNQGWTFNQLIKWTDDLLALRVAMIEQPLEVGEDEELRHFCSPIPLCADESCLTRKDLEFVSKAYQMINIKLDKTGGLTEALVLAREAQSKELDLMVGNMCGTSLAMAPAFVIGQLCKFVDLDGPLLLRYDRAQGMIYKGEVVNTPGAGFWG